MSRAGWISPEERADGRPYAERSEAEPGWPDRLARALAGAAQAPLAALRDPVAPLRWIVWETERYDQRLRAAPDARLRELAQKLRPRLRREGFSPPLVGASFALVREASFRVHARRHFPEQLLGGLALLQGKLVEMATGEGKTMTATLPAATVALAGHPVHVVTVNDYLAERDAEEMGPLYRFLGLSVGCVVQGMKTPERRAAYARAIAYCSNKELAFDYLRDRVASAQRRSRLHVSLARLRAEPGRDEGLVLRGLHYALVDEADSVFIDDARTPLILSATQDAGDERAGGEAALDLARQMLRGEDFALNLAEREVTLTPAGRAKAAAFAQDREGLWTSPRLREEFLSQALSALHLFRRDQHYIVADGKVQIVDESTGRVMPDRSWERGLHQLVEAKEGCAPTARHETLARLTYQRLFRRYLKLAGMSGTAREVAGEIKKIYGLDVVRIPLHRPSRRRVRAPRVWATQAEKWAAVAAAAQAEALRAGRPVVIGTRSVQASEEIARELTRRGVAHALLNAKQDKDEAEIIARAGEPGRVTVATNMAGRGTDIKLGEGVAARGGLHVILTEFHESRRIDRQFFGRCARQGDPGSCEAIVSLEDEIYAIYAGRPLALVRRWVGLYGGAPGAFYGALRGLAQAQAERRGVQMRLQNLKQDRRFDRVLAFSGRGE